ncbi:putative inner membrane protein [compost metagenome]
MNQSSQNDLTRILLASTFIILLSAGVLYVLSPFLAGGIWATMIVVATWPMLLYCQRKLKNKRGLAVTVMMIGLTGIVLVPIAYAVTTLVMNAGLIVQSFRELSQAQIPPPPEWVAKIPIRGADLNQKWLEFSSGGYQSVMAAIQPYLRRTLAWILGSVGSVGVFILHLVLTLAIAGILYSTGEKAVRSVIKFANKLAPDHGEAVIILAGQAIKSVALGIIVTALVQTALGGVSLWIAGVPYPAIFSAVIMVFCIAQIGPLLPMLVGVGWLFYQNENVIGTVMLVWSLAVGLLDNFLRPLLIKRGADLPFLLILSGVIGGLLAFGVMGLFIGPVLLAVAFTLLKSWVAVSEEKDWPEVTPNYRTDVPENPETDSRLIT